MRRRGANQSVPNAIVVVTTVGDEEQGNELARELVVRRPGQSDRKLTTQSRAAFEILTDRSDHGIRVLSPPKSGS